MNPKSITPAWCRQICLTAALLAGCAFLTGCPHNEYSVELKPTPKGAERKLTFFRMDGSTVQPFPSNELAAITAVYPSGAIKENAGKQTATADFEGVMPQDVGGAGTFTNLATSMGSVGYYSERFRGNDDLAARIARQTQAADQITELAMGWSKAEFGHEHGYKQLRTFLDKDFRQDLKNVGIYFWAGEVSYLSNTNVSEEFGVRFVHYLYERGYVKLADAPQIYLMVNGGHAGDVLLPKMIQRIVAEKMGIGENATPPKSFAMFADADALEASLDKYLAGTEAYRAKVKEWEAQKDSKSEKPKPDVVMNDLVGQLLSPFDLFGSEPDHLAVKLALTHPPTHTNGKWQDGRVTWDEQLDSARPLPVFCYANWSDPAESFQKNHFGTVLLTDDGLAEYCLWQNGLGAVRAQEWETFVAGLAPGGDLKQKLVQFHFSGASDDETNQLAIGSNLLVKALGK